MRRIITGKAGNMWEEVSMISKFSAKKNIGKALILVLLSIVLIDKIVCYNYSNIFLTSGVTGEEYVSFAYFMQYFLEVLFLACVTGMVALALFGKKPEGEENGDKEKHIFPGIAFAFSVVMPLLFLFNPLDTERVSVDSFSRMIGVGLIGNWDVKKVVSNFTLIFILAAGVFWAAIKCADIYRHRVFNDEQAQANKVCRAALSVNVAWLGYYGFSYFFYNAVNSPYHVGTVMLLLFIMFVLSYNLLKPECSFRMYLGLLVSLLGLSYGVCAAFFSELAEGRTIAGVWFIMAACMTVVVKLWGGVMGELLRQRVNYKVLLLFCAAIPLLLSLYIELINVLNQWEVFVAYPRGWFGLSMGVLLGLACLAAVLLRKRGPKKDITGIAYMEMIFGFCCMTLQLNLQNYVYADIFETANSGVLISDFLHFGKIPIVEHYGGHMLSNVIGGILYGIINRDYSGAVYTMYYLAYPIFALLFYKVVEMYTTRETAFLAVLFFPYGTLWTYFGMAAVGMLALAYYIKKQNKARALLLWAVVAGCCLYRLDLGAALLESCIVLLVAYAIVKRDRKVITDNFLSGGAVAGCYILAWCILCLWKGISPIDRLWEFVGISASNYIWAYASIGNPSLMAFGWFYIFLPLTEIVCLVLLLSGKGRTRFSEVELLMLIQMGCFYFFNFSRGLVRHSVNEIGVTASCQMVILIYITIAAITAAALRNRNLFMPSLAALLVVNLLIVGQAPHSAMPLLYHGTNKIEPMVESWSLSRDEREAEKLLGEDRLTFWEHMAINSTVADRVYLAGDNEQEVYELQDALDLLLEEDETFLDFVCKSFLYAAYVREDPVYISQTPSMLSNEFTQEQYISQVSGQYERIPIVVMPSDKKGNVGFDNVANHVRYYKVAEYIYQNYRPLCDANGYALWCANDRYEDMMSRLGGAYKGIDWTYKSDNHTFNLQNLPYIWANFDEKEAAANTQICGMPPVAENTYYIEGVEEIEKDRGNYLLVFISSNMDQPVKISGGNEKKPRLSTFSFNVLRGEHYYLIRVSSDYYWYRNLLDVFSMEAMGENGAIKGSMTVLEGD